MKQTITLFLLVVGMLPLRVFSQLNNGGRYANFGVDADTRNNYMKYGLLTGSVVSDDWFSPSLTGKNVIDTSNAAGYIPLLQAGANISFNKRMSVPLYSKVGGKLWLDAVYGRDYMAASSLKDSTTFSIASKNGDNPINWAGGVSSFPDKNDLVDVYAHMRRDGITVQDSLWLFTGVSTYGTSGSRYFDIELYKNNFTYSQSTGKFTTAGTDAGHTQWLFDAGGNIIQTGDMILAVTFSPGTAPVVDVRIWVSQATWSSVSPSHFSFNASFDGATPAFGYASIVSRTGTTAFGAGIANYSGTAAQDTTYSTPWGSSTSTSWSTQYASLQFIEIGLNLSRIGIDPALYTSLGSDACQSLFSSIFFKSRSSASFTSNMHDFMIPLSFVRMPVMDYSLTPDTLRCNKTTGTILITNNSTAGYYTWQTTNGNISGSNADSSQLSITQPGTYIVTAAPAEGCPATRKDTVVIPLDTFPPVASIAVSLVGNFSYLQLYGGNISASNYSTPFGGSQGLLWDWSGPSGFVSTTQNPRRTDTTGAWGTYQLIVTEKRNGCKDTILKPVSMYEFVVLSTEDLKVRGVYRNNSIVLTWEDRNPDLAGSYEIERYAGSDGYKPIGRVLNDGGNASPFVFTDDNPLPGNNRYRIKATGKNGEVYYSGIVIVTSNMDELNSICLAGSSPGSGTATLVINAGIACQADIVMFSISGQRLWDKNVQLNQGVNTIGIAAANARKGTVQVIFVLIKGKVTYSQKVMF